MPDFSGSSLATGVTGTQDPNVDALLWGTQLAVATITYSFPAQGALWAAGYPPAHGVDEVANFTALTAMQQDSFRLAVSKWAELIDVPIVETSDGTTVGDIRAAALTQQPAVFAFAYLPENSPWGSDVWFSPFLANLPDWSPGALGSPYFTVLHELGHALGLRHPSEAPIPIDPVLDIGNHTIMSTTSSGASNFSVAPTTPMVLDVLAIQHLYGANFSTRPGDDIYRYGDEHGYHETIWDGGGNDTIRYAGSHDAQIDLNEGQASMIGLPVLDAGQRAVKNVWIAFGVTIENATGGSGNDVIVGNDGANRLDGSAGNDRLDGHGGTDTALVGSTLSGVQAYSLGNGELTLSTGAGTDVMNGIERVRLSDALFALDTQPGAQDGRVWEAAALFRAGFGTIPGIDALSQWTAQADRSSSMGALGQSMLDFYAPGVSSTALVTHLYVSLLHALPSAETVQGFVDQIGAGLTFATQGDLFAYAASLSLNTDQMVGFAGSIQQLDPAWF
jgi:hypothetical protein